MLAYYSIPNGYGKIGNKQVCGALTRNSHPTHFSHKEFVANRKSLIQAPFTPEYIEEKTGKPDFPYRAYFTLDLLRKLDYRVLQKIATYMGVNALLPRTKLIYSVRHSLQDL